MKFAKKVISVLLVLSIAAGLCSCSRITAGSNKEKFSCDIWNSFDTLITVMAYCDTEDDFGPIEEISRSLFRHYHVMYDIYNDYEGEVNIKTINDNAGISPVGVSSEIIDLIEFGKKLYYETDGDVNIAFGSVLKLWHDAREISENDPEKAYVPDIDALKSASAHCNIDDVIVNEEEGTVFLRDPEMSLDVGAIAKGFAAEMVADALVEAGYDSFLISAGNSSIKAVGKKPDGSSWLTAVETDPEYNMIMLEDKSITTSGVYQRYYDVGGVRYHHIINKDTLMPEMNYMSVTLITDDCGYGDGLATAIFNMDIESGLDFVNSHDGVFAMWINNDKSKIYSDGFEDFIKLK